MASRSTTQRSNRNFKFTKCFLRNLDLIATFSAERETEERSVPRPIYCALLRIHFEP